MKVISLTVGPLQTNCYLVFCLKSKEAIIIDPGDEADFISQKILDLKLKPKAILATHGHFDHLLAAAELKLNFKIPLFLHQNDCFLIKRIYQTASWWLRRRIVGLPLEIDHQLKEGDEISIGSLSLKVIETPGHSPGSVSFHSPQGKTLFSGDTLFSDGFIGRVDFEYSEPEKMEKSLKRLLSLPKETLVFPGHGKKFTL